MYAVLLNGYLTVQPLDELRNLYRCFGLLLLFVFFRDPFLTFLVGHRLRLRTLPIFFFVGLLDKRKKEERRRRPQRTEKEQGAGGEVEEERPRGSDTGRTYT